MKTIGLLGGMSWQSTELYYRCINEETKRVCGGLHSAPMVMASVDFHEVDSLQRTGDWGAAAALLAERARSLESAGAELLLICSNTMHKVADQVEAAINIPLLHLADATAEQVKAKGITKAGLLGTRFTMEQDFYRRRLEAGGLDVLVPHPEDRSVIHRIIYDELCLGVVRDSSRDQFIGIVNELRARGAEGVIEGCTEIGMLLGPADTDVPLFDTTKIHAQQAVTAALA